MASGGVSSKASGKGDNRDDDDDDDEVFRSKSFSNVEDLLSSVHSPETKRKNALLYLRSVSEEVNNKKFPVIIKQQRKKSEADPERQKKFYAWHWRVAIDSVIFLQRLKIAAKDDHKKPRKERTSEDHGSGTSNM